MFNKLLFDKNLMNTCLAAVLALGLAACSSSDNQTTQTPPPVDPAPVEPMPTPAEQLAAAQEAVATARMAVAALTATSTLAEIAEAQSALAAATAQLATASAIPENQIALLQEQIADLQMQINDLQTGPSNAAMAVTDAIAALASAETAEATAQTVAEAAVDALTAAAAAVGAVDSAGLDAAIAAYQTAQANSAAAQADLTAATGAVETARMALESAQATLAEVDPTAVELEAARAALAKAEEDATAQAAEIAALKARIKTLEDAAAAAEKAAMDAEAEAEAMAMAAAGKALKAALGGNPLGLLTSAMLQSGGDELQVDQAVIAGTTTDPVAVDLEAGDSAGSLGAWSGTNFAHTNASTKVSSSAVVYTNQKAPTVEPFATGARQDDGTTALTPVAATATPTTEGEYNAATRTLALGAAPAGATIGGDNWPTAGTTTYTPDSVSGAVVIRGTFMGAMGNYRCSASCTATPIDGGGVTLGGTWLFVHDAGAMTSTADATYLYFGWWLRKDDGAPTAASAFHGELGDVEGNGTLTDPTGLIGSATYVGKAAGKFAINDPLNGGDAGHFTADATLTAKFSGDGAGVTGTIDNFMANDKAVPWSVALNNNTLANDTVGAAPAANFVASGAISSTADLTTATPTVDDSRTTVWSIDGNTAGASGTWSGQMYDEALAPAAASDGSTVPTSVTGTFQSQFGSTHSMVGGFGAERQ